MKATRQNCSGCRNNFYNGNNSLGVAECWSLKSATVETKFSLGRNTPMNIREAYFKCSVPSCYHNSSEVYLDAIPSWAQTKEERDAERARETANAPAGLGGEL